MKTKLLFTLLLLLFTAVAVNAQTASEAKTPAPVAASRIALPPDAQASVTTTSANVRAAQSQLEAAQLRLENLILRLRLTLKVPNDFEMKVGSDGAIYFEKATAQVGSEQAPPIPKKD